MRKTKNSLRILALDPGTRYLGIAALEDEELLYWGVKTIKNRTDSRLLLQKGRRIITELINLYHPNIVVQEKVFFAQCKASERLNKLTRMIRNLVKKKGLTYAEYAPTTVRKQICRNGWATKKETAKILITIYPELAIHLTQDRI